MITGWNNSCSKFFHSSQVLWHLSVSQSFGESGRHLNPTFPYLLHTGNGINRKLAPWWLAWAGVCSQSGVWRSHFCPSGDKRLIAELLIGAYFLNELPYLRGAQTPHGLHRVTRISFTPQTFLQNIRSKCHHTKIHQTIAGRAENFKNFLDRVLKSLQTMRIIHVFAITKTELKVGW